MRIESKIDDVSLDEYDMREYIGRYIKENCIGFEDGVPSQIVEEIYEETIKLCDNDKLETFKGCVSDICANVFELYDEN